MRHATLCYLLRQRAGETSEVCLGRKKVGLGAGRLNGAGGKLLPDETPQDGGRRETQEELGVVPIQLVEAAELTFQWPAKPENDQRVTVFLVPEWSGDPRESDELVPQWFPVSSLPLAEMWEADRYWLPQVLAGELLHARFVYAGDGSLIGCEVSQ